MQLSPCLAAAVLAALVAATPQVLVAQDVDCSNANSQIEMTYCAEQEWNAADADLNAAYAAAKRVMRGIDTAIPRPERGAEMQLRDAQRAWVTFRDAACAAEGYTFHGGTAEPMVIYSCRARLSETRAGELWSLAAQR
jgi:uncharacterized protein YecT (DUF1311 family)